jgi:hypothetical protein
MWVYYLRDWIKLLVKEVELTPAHDSRSEWSTIFHYEIWLIVNSLKYMLYPLAKLDSGAMGERTFESVDRQHENGVPLKGILFCISECWSIILFSELNTYQKDYFYETVMRALEKASHIQDGGKSRNLLVELLGNGPLYCADRKIYKKQFQDLLNGTGNWRPNSVGFNVCADFKKTLFS